MNKRSSVAANRRTLIAYSNPDSIISEQYRTLQTNIKFSVAEKMSRIFLITSPGKEEGKTTTAANLAVSMAQNNESILLIDANLRNPAIHSIFKLPNSTGLVDVLSGKESFEEVIIHTEIGGLDVLTSGAIPSNPVELLRSKKIKDLFQKALKLYDVILVDSNGLLDLTDTMLLIRNCDGVVLVIQNDKTKIEKVKEAKKELDFAKANLVGVVLNN
jgi:capsular exopolysaccharide synthesis family protein